MNNQIIPFKFENTEVRVIEQDGQPWFVGKDVAKILGYKNPQKAIRDHVDEEDVRGERIVHPLGGGQETKLVNESGLYALILSSKMPNARKFKHWVTSEVLPSIRQHGGYMAGQNGRILMFNIRLKASPRLVGILSKHVGLTREQLL